MCCRAPVTCSEIPALLARLQIPTCYMCRFGFPAIKPPEPFTCSSASSLQDALGNEAAGAACTACDAWLSGQQHSAAADSTTAHAAPTAFWLLLLLPDGICQSHPLSAWQQVP